MLRRALVCSSLVFFSFGCGSDDDSGSNPGTGGTSTGGTSSGGTSSGGTGGSSGASTGGSAGTSTGGSSGAGTGGSAGAPPECNSLPAGPITPTVVTQGFNGSEDLAFDGKGNIVAKDGGQVVKISASDQKTQFANLAGQTYGIRFAPNGDLIAAQPNASKLVKISTAGDVTDFVTGLSGPNGVYVASDGTTYVTEFGASRVTKIAPGATTGTPVASGAALGATNGVVLDEKRNLLFFTDYASGKVYSVSPAGGGTPDEVGQVTGAALDGLVLDACGNVYAVDQGNSRLYRFELDAAGALVGQPALLADFPQNVANAQFGSGTGFNPNSLYAAGNPGVVYEVPVGVPGAPVPTEP